MSYLTGPGVAWYACACGARRALTHLYFCRHCLLLRCAACICHEVDSHYCANCLENMPSSEARLKKNRCSSCFDCPSCFHTLSTRATMASQPRPPPTEGGDAKIEPKQPKKMYYLSCFNCRWTSRDVGIPDQPVASGGWPERLNSYMQRVNAIQEHYKSLALHEKQEKLERERKKFTIRGKYITLTDKLGLTGAMARNIAGMSDGGSFNSMNMSGFTPSQASADINDLPEDIFTKELNLKQVTNMVQRLAVAEWQPTTVDRLHPIPKLLSIKRSQRCRTCDHNLTKPEYNPGSIKFKIELLAYYHIPEVRIISCEPLKPGGRSSLLLKFTNPTGYEMTFRILPPDYKPSLEEEEERSEDKVEEIKEIMKKDAMESSVNAQLEVPDVRLTLAQRDDAAEYDDDASSYNDHPNLVLWRKSNKMALRLSVKVDEGLQDGSKVSTGLLIEYSYMNTVPPTAANQSRQPQEHTLAVSVILNLGKLYLNAAVCVKPEPRCMGLTSQTGAPSQREHPQAPRLAASSRGFMLRAI